MPGTSKATLITDHSASDNDSQSPTFRPPVSLPAEHLIEAARSRLRTELAQHNDGNVPEIVERAVDRSIEWHAGQVRKSGEPYVVHPIEVAILLSRMSVDTEAIIAALLHDVVEDSAVSLDTVRAEFGDRVALPGRRCDEAGSNPVDRRRRPGHPRARGPGRKPAQDVPGDDRRHRRGPDQAGRPPAQHAHARPHAAREAGSDRAADDGDLRAAGEPARYLAVQVGAGRSRLPLSPTRGVQGDQDTAWRRVGATRLATSPGSCRT